MASKYFPKQNPVGQPVFIGKGVGLPHVRTDGVVRCNGGPRKQAEGQSYSEEVTWISADDESQRFRFFNR
jgi:hypothetical protein